MIKRSLVLLLALTASGNATPTQFPSPLHSPIRVSICTKPPSTHKLLGWGKYGLHFLVPKGIVEITGGKPDVDYVTYVVKPRKDGSVLAFWFGLLAMNPSTHQEMEKAVTTFTKTDVVDSNGAVIGVDYEGSSADGHRWRKFVVGHEGALYEDIAPANADLFDSIINSPCFLPYPK